ncbi:MAG: cell wall hydrolase [Agathobacter sp.]|nr:cell wall hydrolase [Agathobacter sp.]
MKSNFKLKLLCSTLALSLLVTACGSANGEGTEVDTMVEDTQDVSVQEDNKDVVTIPSEEPEVELTDEEKEWQNYLMADVELRLRVRVEPNTEADVVGVLEKGDRATVIEKGEAWTKISSGDVEGYVSNEFCLYGTDALNHAKEVCDVIATSTSDLLNIRQAMNTESEVLAKFQKDTNLVVDKTATTEEGWVAVIFNGKTAYVSAEYVTLKMDIGTAITVEELYIREKAEAQAAAQAQAQAQSKPQGSGSTSNAGSTSGGTTIYSPVIANASEYEVLAAMVWCESGNQSYECNLAVASVIMNRVRNSKFPNTVKEVVFAPGQFPPATGGSLEKCLTYGKTTENCYKAAQAALNGEDNTDGCLYFNTYKGDREGLRIGAMVFWKSWK